MSHRSRIFASWILASSIFAGMLGLPLLAVAAVSRIPADASLVEPESLHIDSAQTAADAMPALAAVARGDAAQAHALLRRLPGAARYEAAAAQVIEQLQQQPPSAAADALLEALSREPVRLYRRHDETAGDWFVPVFDVPGRAGSARTLLARVLERDRLLPRLRRGDAQPLAAGASDPAALVAALELLSAAEARQLATRALHDAKTLTPGVWSALARRSPEASTLDAVLRFEPPAEALALLQHLPAALPTEKAYAWLDRALDFGEYRSAAVAGVGREAARSPLAARKLFELLADTDAATGASAAAALARLPVEQRFAEYDRVLAKSRDPKLLERVALALRLDDTPEARHRLQRLKDDPRLTDAVREELQR